MLFSCLLHRLQLLQLSFQLLLLIDGELLQVVHGEQGVRALGTSLGLASALGHEVGRRGQQAVGVDTCGGIRGMAGRAKHGESLT